jgi:hypothetical protein
MLAGFHKDLLGVVVGPWKGDVLGLDEISALGRSVTVVGTSKYCKYCDRAVIQQYHLDNKLEREIQYLEHKTKNVFYE